MTLPAVHSIAVEQLPLELFLPNETTPDKRAFIRFYDAPVVSIDCAAYHDANFFFGEAEETHKFVEELFDTYRRAFLTASPQPTTVAEAADLASKALADKVRATNPEEVEFTFSPGSDRITDEFRAAFQLATDLTVHFVAQLVDDGTVITNLSYVPAPVRADYIAWLAGIEE